MDIRDFSGADFEGASRFLGSCRHASCGERSYWYGGYDLAEALSASSHALVATEGGAIAGIIALAAPDGSGSADLRMHWLQQRQIIMTVARSLGFDPAHDECAQDNGASASDFLVSSLGAARPYVRLCVVGEGCGVGLAGRLRDAALAWLAGHGLPAQAAGQQGIELVPNGEGDVDAIARILDAHGASAGHEFRTFGYHVERAAKLVAGIHAWSYGSDLHIDMLAVAEDLRRSGVGRLLVERVEDEARECGCTTASVDTFSWQAPLYYPALGYEETHRDQLDDGTYHVYFSKRL